MKIYLVKHKGKTWWGNLVGLCNTMHIGKYTCHTIQTFFYKRDAVKYLEAMPNKQLYEVISATLSNSKADNREKSK